MHTCLRYAEELSAIVAGIARRHNCDCILFSGGIDTSFVALSLNLDKIRFHAITVVFPENSVDENYSRILSEKLGFSHEIVYGSVDDVEECLRIIVSVFRTIDPVEVVCDIPVCIGLKHALKRGCTCVLTGDGGDELFLGYDFLLGLSARDLEAWLNNVMGKEYFSAEKIGEYMGLRVISGLFTEEVRAFSQSIPLECRINSYNNVTWGKFLLRRFLAKHGLGEIAWRKKTPINIGSGSNSLLYEWGKEMKMEEIIKLSRSSNIYFPSRAHAYLYRKLLEYSVEPPGTCRDPNSLCPICGRCMSKGHCSFCGASLRSKFQVDVYSDETLRELFGDVN